MNDELNEFSFDNFKIITTLFNRIIKRKHIELNSKKTSDNPFNKTNVVNRDNVIGEDDLNKLKILLKQSKNVDDFIKNM